MKYGVGPAGDASGRPVKARPCHSIGHRMLREGSHPLLATSQTALAQDVKQMAQEIKKAEARHEMLSVLIRSFTRT
jgi:hypothetical protein